MVATPGLVLRVRSCPHVCTTELLGKSTLHHLQVFCEDLVGNRCHHAFDKWRVLLADPLQCVQDAAWNIPEDQFLAFKGLS